MCREGVCPSSLNIWYPQFEVPDLDAVACPSGAWFASVLHVSPRSRLHGSLLCELRCRSGWMRPVMVMLELLVTDNKRGCRSKRQHCSGRPRIRERYTYLPY